MQFYETYLDNIYQYQNPSLYTWYDQVYRNPSVAIFGSPVDLRLGSPQIYYQVKKEKLVWSIVTLHHKTNKKSHGPVLCYG